MQSQIRDSEPLPWTQQVKGIVRRRYAHLAETDGFRPGGAERARRAGYPQDWLDGLPDRVAGSYCGCGYPLEDVDLAGVRVAVDLGCGAGLDARLLAGRLAAGGMVVALDLTPGMLARVGEATRVLSGSEVCRVAGDMERLPLRDGVADLVLANASFNLTVDMGAAFAEAARILRPGGRLVARELIRDGELPPEIAEDPTAWNASLGGVVEEDELRQALRAAGFVGVCISRHRPFPPMVAVRLEGMIPA
jgi:SAM-dependent methyltransferase